MDPFCYSFRFCCDPGFNDRRELETLRRFCEAADIDDVAVFCNVEELNTGHMPLEEQKTWLSLLDSVQAAVAPLGITTSVNHWHSLMHADLGKTLRPGQSFRRMVDPDGREAQLCVCPMCEDWQNYFAALYSRYAEKKPFLLWVEDDFRLHNHDPLRWGGCFCDAHMAEYARRAGKALTRAEFVAGVLAPGTPHPYRKIWLDVNRETMVALAEKIGHAVHAVSPETRVGLMSSVPFVHSAEGRDWHGLLRGFAGSMPPVDRIHLPCYSEISPREYLMQFNMISMANRALIPADTEVYPELENYPYSLFSKSRRFTRFQLLSSLPLNPSGMTIDLFDLNGGGIVESDGYQQMLRAVKPFLNEVTRRGVLGLPKLGVCVMLCETASYTLHTAQGRGMEELYPQEVYFAGLLNAMGISFQYCTDPDIRGQVCAVSGQYFRNLTEAQIRSLFANNALILSGDAVEVLCELGLGRLAGVEACRWMRQNGGEYTYEQVCDGGIYGGLPLARASAVISSADVLSIRYARPHRCYTKFYNSYRAEAGPGHVLVEDRVLIHPFGHFSAPNSIPPMQLGGVRRDILQDAVARLRRRLVPMVLGNAYLQPYAAMEGHTLYLYLVNGSSDPAEGLRLDLGRCRPKELRILDSGCQERRVPFVMDGACTVDWTLPPMDACLITIQLEEEVSYERQDH